MDAEKFFSDVLAADANSKDDAPSDFVPWECTIGMYVGAIAITYAHADAS